jgi:hypothetical protein
MVIGGACLLLAQGSLFFLLDQFFPDPIPLQLGQVIDK